MSRIKIACIAGLLTSITAVAAPLPDYTFKSPAFNGVGYSSHVLTIENQEFTRQKAAADAIQSKLEKAANDAKNTNIQKFMNNLVHSFPTRRSSDHRKSVV